MATPTSPSERSGDTISPSHPYDWNSPTSSAGVSSRRGNRSASSGATEGSGLTGNVNTQPQSAGVSSTISRSTTSAQQPFDDHSNRTSSSSLRFTTPQQADDGSVTSPSRESSAVSTVIQELQTSPTRNQREGLQQPANSGGNTRGVNTETVVPNDTLRIEDETSEPDNLPPGIITLHDTMQTGVDRLHRGNHRSHRQNRRGSLEDPDSLVSRTFAQPQEIVEERHNQLSTGFEGETEVKDNGQCESKRVPSHLRCIIGSIAAFPIVIVLIFSIATFTEKRTPLEYGLSITILCCIAIFDMFLLLRLRKSIFCCR